MLVISIMMQIVMNYRWELLGPGRGEVDINVRAVDVSESGDWSRVKVWHTPINALGRTAYPAFGFIHPKYEGQNAKTVRDALK